ncbi:uncharacterized protein LOC107304731 [Oryza brachyantha]|uniref:uncharacterized protein LOC107304731 n=1 Tax=Oryza brachyantha TaxID=4533 RepID=UPI001AD95CA6|nr:uncharacterized protein LOC107304731 [Oryza brachyantha]
MHTRVFPYCPKYPCFLSLFNSTGGTTHPAIAGGATHLAREDGGAGGADRPVSVAPYNVDNMLSLPSCIGATGKSSAARDSALSDDPEMHGANDPGQLVPDEQGSRVPGAVLLRDVVRVGNMCVFGARLGSFHRAPAPRLYALCIGLLAWNVVVYSLPLFLLLCCFVLAVSYALGYNMNSMSVGRDASDEQLAALPQW